MNTQYNPRILVNRIHSGNRLHSSFSDRLVDIIIITAVLLVIIAIVYPLWFIIIASISNVNDVAGGRVLILPKGIQFAGYERIFEDIRIWRGYSNTIIYSILGTILNMIVTIPASFALARREFKPRRIILFILTFTMFFSGGLIPNYLLYRDLNLLDSMWVFILPGAVNVYNLIVARSFFETSIPEDLHDAAQIDGLGYFGYFIRIVVPLSSAIIAVIGLYYFVQHWNDYFTGLIYIRTTSRWPLQNVLQSILLSNQTAQNTATYADTAEKARQVADQIKYGVIIVSTLPLLVAYPFLQKYFNKGVMIGAVKG